MLYVSNHWPGAANVRGLFATPRCYSKWAEAQKSLHMHSPLMSEILLKSTFFFCVCFSALGLRPPPGLGPASPCKVANRRVPIRSCLCCHDLQRVHWSGDNGRCYRPRSIQRFANTFKSFDLFFWKDISSNIASKIASWYIDQRTLSQSWLISGFDALTIDGGVPSLDSLKRLEVPWSIWSCYQSSAMLRSGRSSSAWTQRSWNTMFKCWRSLLASHGYWHWSRCGFNGAPGSRKTLCWLAKLHMSRDTYQ